MKKQNHPIELNFTSKSISEAVENGVHDILEEEECNED
jgi:hypothetical protein